MGTTLVCAVLLCGAVACTGSPAPAAPPAPRPMRWAAADLPVGTSALLVRAAEGVVLVATRSGERASMYRLATPGAGPPAAVSLEPHGVYAPGARWVDLATDGSRVLAVGRASGGAHGLPRWTVWDGTPARLVEQPQPFETFGGPRSGGLAAVGLGREAVLVGTWDDGGAGLDARLWTKSSPAAWERLPATPALAGTDRLLPQPAAVAWSSTRLLVAGAVTELGEGSSVVTRAAVWTAPTARGPWTRHDLPASSTSARATGAACAGETCWVVGLDGEGPSAWVVTPGAVTRVPLPEVPTTPGAPPAVSVAAGSPWVAVAGRDHTVLALRQGGGWVAVQGPPGRPVSLAASPGRLVLVTRTATGTRLWTAPTG
ncbi:hypothetical protein GCM10009845_32870 [Pedococcus bigeumensis]